MKSEDFHPIFRSDLQNIAIDFDGVLHDSNLGFHDGTCYGAPIEGALDAVRELAKNYQIVVFTAKAKPDRPLILGKTGKQLVEEWLSHHGFLPFIKEVTAEKPRALLYIDDNAFRFYDWSSTLEFVKKL